MEIISSSTYCHPVLRIRKKLDLRGMYLYLCLYLTSSIAIEAENTTKPMEKLCMEVMEKLCVELMEKLCVEVMLSSVLL